MNMNWHNIEGADEFKTRSALLARVRLALPTSRACRVTTVALKRRLASAV